MAYQRYGEKELETTIDLLNEKTFEGYYLGPKTIKTKSGERLIHRFKSKEKKTVNIWGKALLDYKLNEIYQAYPGILCRIEHLGKQTYKDKKTGQVKQSHQFQIDIDEEQYWKEQGAPAPERYPDHPDLPMFDSDEKIPF